MRLLSKTVNQKPNDMVNSLAPQDILREVWHESINRVYSAEFTFRRRRQFHETNIQLSFIKQRYGYLITSNLIYDINKLINR